MNKPKNIVRFTLAIIALIASNSFVYANENTQANMASDQTHATYPETNQNQPQNCTTNPNVSVIIQNNHGAKRNVALTRILWAIIKNSIGTPLLSSGAIGTIGAPFGIAAGLISFNGPLVGSSAIAFMCSFPLTYLGYKLIQSGLNTIRDELIESAGLK